jgi:hypothetical protein
MNSEQTPCLRDVWALTWRSIAFAPLMLLAFIPLLVLGVSLFALPLFGSTENLVLYVVADNPIGESVHYHDSKKWAVRSPERRVFRGEPLEHYDGEE